MKKTITFLACAVVGSILLTGCGGSTSGSNTDTSYSNTAQSTPASTDIKTGVKKMLSIATDLKNAIQTANETKVKDVGPTLEDTWATFEDQVKPKYPDQYKNIETYLDPTIAGSKATPLDKEALSKMNDQLIHALTDLHNKVQ